MTTSVRLLVHGGAGPIPRDGPFLDRIDAHHAALAAALRAGYAALRDGSAVDGVVAAVAALEDEPLFNAGRGSVFSNEGVIEMDAAVMRGEDRGAGAVTCVRQPRNPVKVARLVMERTRHVLLAAGGADRFAAEMGAELEAPDYFFVQERYDRMLAAREKEQLEVDHAGLGAGRAPVDGKHGTVGAVAIDAAGNIAAATSTGGLTNKRWSRVGDTPILGAGTFADNATVAVSFTGVGEYVMRAVAGHAVHALIRHAGHTLAGATAIVLDDIRRMGGEAGLIAIGPGGDFAMPYNTDGMFRGVIDGDGQVRTGIHEALRDG